MEAIETKKGNGLMAKFMGVEPCGDWYDGHALHKAGLPFKYGAEGNGTNDLRFHTSWDWLMPVVDKIESLGYDSEIKFREMQHHCLFNDSTIDQCISYSDKKIDAVYYSVFKFVKWYLKNNEKTIVENAILLARFEGYNVSGLDGRYPTIHYSDDNERTAIDTAYHNSFDKWLKPVMDKIQNLGYPITIWIDGVNISDGDGNDIIVKDLGNCQVTGMIPRLYEAFVDFVKWYNKNNPK